MDLLLDENYIVFLHIQLNREGQEQQITSTLSIQYIPFVFYCPKEITPRQSAAHLVHVRGICSFSTHWSVKLPQQQSDFTVKLHSGELALENKILTEFSCMVVTEKNIRFGTNSRRNCSQASSCCYQRNSALS